MKNVKVVTGIVFTLVVFSVLLLITGSLFYSSVSSDRENFQSSRLLNVQQQELAGSFLTLVKARVIVSHVANRELVNQRNPETLIATNTLLKNALDSLNKADRYFSGFFDAPHITGQNEVIDNEAKDRYQKLHSLLQQSIGLLQAGNYQAYENLGVQQAQDDMNETYQRWLMENTRLLQTDAEDNQHSFVGMKWTLGTIFLIVIAVLVLIWVGLRRILLGPLQDVMKHISTITGGDLTHSIDIQGRNEMSRLAAGLHAMQDSLIRTVSVVRDNADSIYNGASEISAGSNDLSSRTEQQAASLEETAASMEQLTATVKQNSDNARQAAKLAKNASETALKGGVAVNNVVTTMSEITKSSAKIVDIISIIDSIAFQTNILALNAAVEAARAGEQGRGFAVVAGEVRTLASRSALAAKEIKGLIANSVSRIDIGSNQAREAGDTMKEIVTAITGVTDIMGEIALASDEQSKGIGQVAHAVSEMDNVTQQNASLVEESVAAAAVLEGQASQLREAVAVFRIEQSKKRSVTPQPAETPRPKPAVLKPQRASVGSESNWETF